MANRVTKVYGPSNIIRNFLGSSSILHRKVITVAWNQYCLSLAIGGLGIKNLSLFNKSLLSSMAWKILTDPSIVLVFLNSRLRDKQHYVDIFYMGNY